MPEPEAGLGASCLGGATYLLASEMMWLVVSASCWHLIFSAVAFSNAEVRLLRLALSSWEGEAEADAEPGAAPVPPEREAASAHRNLVLDARELVLGLGQFCVGLLQGLPLGGHVTVHLVEAHDVDAPGAQPGRRRGLGADELGVERGVPLVGPERGRGSLSGWTRPRWEQVLCVSKHFEKKIGRTQVLARRGGWGEGRTGSDSKRGQGG